MKLDLDTPTEHECPYCQRWPMLIADLLDWRLWTFDAPSHAETLDNFWVCINSSDFAALGLADALTLPRPGALAFVRRLLRTGVRS